MRLATKTVSTTEHRKQMLRNRKRNNRLMSRLKQRLSRHQRRIVAVLKSQALRMRSQRVKKNHRRKSQRMSTMVRIIMEIRRTQRMKMCLKMNTMMATTTMKATGMIMKKKRKKKKMRKIVRTHWMQTRHPKNPRVPKKNKSQKR